MGEFRENRPPSGIVVPGRAPEFSLGQKQLTAEHAEERRGSRACLTQEQTARDGKDAKAAKDCPV